MIDGFYTNVCLNRQGKILYKGVDPSGNQVLKEYDFEPTLFLQTVQETGYRDIYGTPAKPYSFPNVFEARNFIKEYKGTNLQIYGNSNYVNQFISEAFPEENIRFDLNKVRRANIDIEVYSDDGFPEPIDALHPINAVTYYDNYTDKYFVLGWSKTGDWKYSRSPLVDSEVQLPKDKIVYKECKDEAELIKLMMELFIRFRPDILTGWNVETFDVPYIWNRVKNLFGEKFAKQLSPWGNVRTRSFIDEFGNDAQAVHIDGMEVIDMLQAYKKFGTYATQESYKLDHIAMVEVGVKKLQYDEESLFDLWLNDYQTFIDYNIRDVILVELINNKKGLLDQICSLSYASRMNFSDVFSPVKMWESIVYNHLKKENIVIPATKKNNERLPFPGGFVKEPQVGLHGWTASFDLASLYPSLIRQYNISPETLVERHNLPEDIQSKLKDFVGIDHFLYDDIPTELLEKHNLTVTPNGEFYRKDVKGFANVLMEKFYFDRKAYKKQMLGHQKNAEMIHDELIKRGLK